jgi:hypothetical protein
MYFIDQLRNADTQTVIASFYNAERIKIDTFANPDKQARVNHATALMVMDSCKQILRERNQLNEL